MRKFSVLFAVVAAICLFVLMLSGLSKPAFANVNSPETGSILTGSGELPYPDIYQFYGHLIVPTATQGFVSVDGVFLTQTLVHEEFMA